MGKAALDKIQVKIDKILQTKREEFREELDRLDHRYTVDANNFANQLVAQLKHVRRFSPLTDAQYMDKLIELSKVYTKELRQQLENYGGVPEGGGNYRYKVLLTSDTKVGKLSIFRTLAAARAKPLDTLRKSLVKEIFGNFVDEDKYYDYSTLSTSELIEIQNDLKRKTRRTVGKDSDIERYQELASTIFGYYDKVKGEIKRGKDDKSAVRKGGLSHLGHAKAGAVNQRIIPRLAQEIASESVESMLRQKGIKVDISSAFKRTRANPTLTTLGSKSFDIIVEVFDESARQNLGDSSKERARVDKAVKRIKKILMSELSKEDWVNQKGSSSYKDATEIALLNTVVLQFSKVPNAKTNIRRKSIDISSSKSTKVTPAKSSSVSNRSGGTGNKVISPPSITQPTNEGIEPNKNSNKNWNQLLPLINAKLPPRVMANMRFPSLVNRTGAFANSAEVLSIETTKDGYPSFVYNYERNPYDVFDRTLGRSPWNTPERDPSTLVDKSVREIVREMAIGRFYTRRA